MTAQADRVNKPASCSDRLLIIFDAVSPDLNRCDKPLEEDRRRVHCIRYSYLVSPECICRIVRRDVSKPLAERAARARVHFGVRCGSSLERGLTHDALRQAKIPRNRHLLDFSTLHPSLETNFPSLHMLTRPCWHAWVIQTRISIYKDSGEALNEADIHNRSGLLTSPLVVSFVTAAKFRPKSQHLEPARPPARGHAADRICCRTSESGWAKTAHTFLTQQFRDGPNSVAPDSTGRHPM